MDKNHSLLAITYGSLELFELINRVPKVNITIPEKLKFLSHGVRLLIFKKFTADYQQLVKEPEIHPKTVTTPVVAAAPATA